MIFDILTKNKNYNMGKNRSFSAIVLVFVMSFLLVSFNVNAQEREVKPWPVPDEFKNMANPVAKSEASNKAGMVLYTKYCGSCHGKTGLGDGVKARALKDFAGDFSGGYYQNQTDGEHFYKTRFGRGEMPKYEGKLSDEDMWNIVNYMRTFKK
ncbi:MAG TPA: cytochrome C [Bacteroidales bacterium]|nr:cytochrome C [Bacteroidales bacterium]